MFRKDVVAEEHRYGFRNTMMNGRTKEAMQASLNAERRENGSLPPRLRRTVGVPCRGLSPVRRSQGKAISVSRLYLGQRIL